MAGLASSPRMHGSRLHKNSRTLITRTRITRIKFSFPWSQFHWNLPDNSHFPELELLPGFYCIKKTLKLLRLILSWKRQAVLKPQRTKELDLHISANGVFAVNMTCYANRYPWNIARPARTRLVIGTFLNGRIFLPVQPVYTEPCKFCYRLQYCLPSKNLHGPSGPV